MLLALIALAAGCTAHQDEPPPAPPAVPTASCPAGQATGDRDVCCPAGTTPAGTVCAPAGVPPERCGAGFAPDTGGGCTAVLPDATCADGWIAVPGDTQCRELSQCGTGSWGDIAVEASTQYVDGSYPGADSDGSAAKPWTTVMQAVTAAQAGAIVAVAAGSYDQNVVVSGKPVRIWGRCPAMVELSSSSPMYGTVELRAGADGSVLRGVAVTGPAIGVFVFGAMDAVIDSVWVHDTGTRGVDVEAGVAATSATLVNTLVERSHVAGVFVATADVSIESSAVRDTLAGANGFGRGVYLREHQQIEQPSSGSLIGSLLERSREGGVYVNGSSLSVAGTVVRDTLPLLGGFGVGISVNDSETSGHRGSLELEASNVERSMGIGIFVRGSDATVEAAVVRDTMPIDGAGRAIDIERSAVTGQRGQLILRQSLLERSVQTGLFVAASSASIESSIIRDTALDPSGAFGLGVGVRQEPLGTERSELQLVDSLVERSHAAGILLQGADVTIDHTAVRDTRMDASALFGWGIGISQQLDTGGRTVATIVDAIVDGSHGFGVALVGSEAALEQSLIANTAPYGDGRFGDGVTALPALDEASAELIGVTIENSTRAGVSLFAAQASLEASLLHCQAIDLAGETHMGTPFVFDDRGANLCGCPDAADACKLANTTIGPPAPLDAP